MVQLGIRTGRGGFSEWMKGFSGQRKKSWNDELVKLNREKMARIFLAAIEQYNIEVSQKEVVDKNGVHIAEQLISPEGFKLVAGYHIDSINEEREVESNYGVYIQNLTTTIYSNLVIGYNWQTEVIVIVKVDAELNSYSDTYVFSKKNVFKAKHGWFSDMFQIYDRSESFIKNLLTFLSFKNRTTFMVDAEMDGSLRDEKGGSILIYMRQPQERADFVNFFRKFAK